MGSSFWSTRTLTIVGALAAISACSSDPTLSNNVKQQGPEDPNIPKGEYHRAGQACLACHNSKGPAPEFTVAGTIFLKPADAKNRTLQGVDQAEVLLVDGNGNTAVATTNCVGNFYLTKSKFKPVYPIKVAIAHPQFGQSPMGSTIGRDGSCATCHRNDRALDSVGNVYLTADPNATYAPPDCAYSTTLDLGPLGGDQ
jgi:mono/diheme cytochrome c family protein